MPRKSLSRPIAVCSVSCISQWAVVSPLIMLSPSGMPTKFRRWQCQVCQMTVSAQHFWSCFLRHSGQIELIAMRPCWNSLSCVERWRWIGLMAVARRWGLSFSKANSTYYQSNRFYSLQSKRKQSNWSLFSKWAPFNSILCDWIKYAMTNMKFNSIEFFPCNWFPVQI